MYKAVLEKVVRELGEVCFAIQSINNNENNEKDATNASHAVETIPNWAQPLIEFIHESKKAQQGIDGGNGRAGRKTYAGVTAAGHTPIDLTKSNMDITGNAKIVDKVQKRVKVTVEETDWETLKNLTSTQIKDKINGLGKGKDVVAVNKYNTGFTVSTHTPMGAKKLGAEKE